MINDKSYEEKWMHFTFYLQFNILLFKFCFLHNFRLHDTDAVVLALKGEIKNLEMTILELEQTNQVCIPV